MPFPRVSSTARVELGAWRKGLIKPMFLPMVVESYCLPYSKYYTPTSSVHMGLAWCRGLQRPQGQGGDLSPHIHSSGLGAC